MKDSGFFVMDDANKIADMTLPEAKIYLQERINSKPNAHRNNIYKARTAVDRCQTVTQLMFTVSNFVIAHDYPTEKVI